MHPLITDFPFLNSFWSLFLCINHSFDRLVNRNTEFYGDKHLGSIPNGNTVHASTDNNYNDSSESQREDLSPEHSETPHQENHYSAAQSDQEYTYGDAKQQMNTPFDASLTNVMVSYIYYYQVRKVLQLMVVDHSF